MRWHARWRVRLRALLAPGRADQDLADELQFHLDAQTSAYQAQGLPPAAARARALRDFGSPDVMAAHCRDSRGLRLWRDGWRDVRAGWCAARRAPGTTLAAIATLAIGIGSATAMFGVVDAVVLRPLPFPSSSRLVRADQRVAPGALDVYRAHARTLDTIGLVQSGFDVNLGAQAEPLRLHAARVSDQVLPMLGIAPERGRGIAHADLHAGAAPVVLVGHDLWQRRFDARADLVGETIRVDGLAREVIGILPPGALQPLADADLILPATTTGLAPAALWGSNYYELLGRVRDDASAEDATADLRRLAPVVRDSYPWRMPDVFGAEIVAVPLLESLVGAGVRQRLLVLGLAAALLLLSACANVATLVLARAVARQREFAVRAAIGASRRRLARQLLTETLALWLCGGTLGWILAGLALAVVHAVAPPDIPRLATTSLDWRAFSGCLALTLLTGLAFGLAPAWRLARVDVLGALKDSDGRVATSAGGQWVVQGLVVAQLASAVVLVSGSVLLTQSLWNLSRVSPGLDARDVLTASLTPDRAVCDEEARCESFYATLVERLTALPSVTAVGLSNGAPIGGPSHLFAIDVEGHPVAPGAPAFTASRLVVTPDYFRAIDQPIIRGRALTPQDSASSAPVALVNEAFVRRFWPGDDPIGRRVRYVWQPTWRTVVGVVGDVRLAGLSQEVPLAFYLPYGQERPRDLTLLVESSTPWSTLSRAVADVVRQTSPDVPVSDVRPLASLVEGSLAGTSSLQSLVAAFSVVVLVLSAVGTYGLLAGQVSARQRELAIRLVLGARHGAIRGLVVREAVRVCLVAFAVGIPVAYWAARQAEPLLFGTSVVDVSAQALVLVVMTAVALVAALVPAVRAARVDPGRVVRGD